MSSDVTETGVRREGWGEEASRSGWEPTSEHDDPTRLLSATLGEELFAARLARFSEKDYSNSLRKSYMQNTDFWVKPQQLNRLQRNERESANNAKPPGASYGYRCDKHTARGRGKHCHCALQLLMFPSERGSLELRCEHISLPC